VATVFVNGMEVGNSENMFRRYSFDIKSELVQLKSEQTPIEITIAFESPITYSERKFEEQKNNLYVVPPGVNFINIKRTNFSCENSFWQLLLRTCN